MIGANEPPSEPETQPKPEGAPPVIRRHSVADLLLGAREAILVHDGCEYRLRVTANGKLILTK